MYHRHQNRNSLINSVSPVNNISIISNPNPQNNQIKINTNTTNNNNNNNSTSLPSMNNAINVSSAYLQQNQLGQLGGQPAHPSQSPQQQQLILTQQPSSLPPTQSYYQVQSVPAPYSISLMNYNYNYNAGNNNNIPQHPHQPSNSSSNGQLYYNYHDSTSTSAASATNTTSTATTATSNNSSISAATTGNPSYHNMNYNYGSNYNYYSGSNQHTSYQEDYSSGNSNHSSGSSNNEMSYTYGNNYNYYSGSNSLPHGKANFHHLQSVASKGSSLDAASASQALARKCPVCDKMFNRPSGLRTHMHSHTGEKPYMCEWDGCGKLFSVRSNMMRHYKIHLKKKEDFEKKKLLMSMMIDDYRDKTPKTAPDSPQKIMDQAQSNNHAHEEAEEADENAEEESSIFVPKAESIFESTTDKTPISGSASNLQSAKLNYY